jgi:mannobiose 2-epimerase
MRPVAGSVAYIVNVLSILSGGNLLKKERYYVNYHVVHFKILIRLLAILLLPVAGLYAQPGRKDIADKMEWSIKHELLNKWYPQSVDSLYGGFLSTYTYDFKPSGDQEKFIVTQARHTWTTSKAAIYYPDHPEYLYCARQGFNYLRNVMWDKDYGGFYLLTDRKGNVINNGPVVKEAYGNAFAIFALAAYYEASKDTAAKNLAIKAFLWLEKNSHDPVYKGYFQHLSREGKPLKRTKQTPSTAELGYKDQNSSIHLLEAFSELYSIWPDPLLKERLTEMLLLIRDKITTPRGNLVLFFQPDWTPVSYRDSAKATILQHHNIDHVSVGHDIETAYLMLEAAHALSRRNDTTTAIVAKRMVDHALDHGWDNTVGAFYDEGYYFKGDNKMTITRDSKNWWAQAEGMNTLLLMADAYPKDSHDYYGKFTTMWNYINTYLIDHENGDWYDAGLDKSPDRKTALKGQIWKGTYHHFRSLHNCVQRLRGLE